MEVADNAPFTVEGDPVRLRQVLSNLIGNAIKFTEQGGITLRVWVDSRQGDDFILRFEVEDSGSGIDQADVEQLLDAFIQLETGQAGGTGLGLAISRRTFQLMGGDIAVRPSRGGGSVFSFPLPLKRLHKEALVHPQNHTTPLDDYSGRRVLVDEDNANNAQAGDYPARTTGWGDDGGGRWAGRTGLSQ